MKNIVIYWLLVCLFACRKNKEQVSPDGSVPYSQIKQRSNLNPDTPLGQYFRDPATDKDVFVLGLKNNDGYLKTIQHVLVSDPKTKDWLLYELNDNYLPKWVRLSKNYTLLFSDYNLVSQTFTVTVYQTDTQSQVQVVKNLKISENALKWAEAARKNLNQDLRNARVARECDESKYRAAAAAYFAFNAAGCALGIAEFGTGLGTLQAILSAYNTYQNCISALQVLANIAQSKPAVECPSATDLANSGAGCLEGELTAFAGQPYNFIQSCASGFLATAAAQANCDCDKQQPKPPARSTGDPHIRTLDELDYSFQGHGEFVVLKATSNDLEIQARQEDYNNTGMATVNTAVVVRMGNDVVQVNANPARLYINRSPITTSFTEQKLANGTLLTKDPDKYTLTNSQGDKVVIGSRGGYYLLDYLVTLSSVRAGKVTGLLGNFDGNPDNDLTLSSGATVEVTFANLHGTFAESWRVKSGQSLFVYEAGKNSDSYTLRTFPAKRPAFDEARLEWAKNVCQQAGVSDPDYLQDCVFDVAVTGDEALAQSSLWMQQADGISPAVPLASNSDLKLFQNVRLEISPSQTNLDQANLIDFDEGKVYKLREGAANAAKIDAIATEYCAHKLSTPFTFKTCDISCGTFPTWDIIQKNWPKFQKGQLIYLNSTNNEAAEVAVNVWNSLRSKKDISLVIKKMLNPNEIFNAVSVRESSLQCKPTAFQNAFLYGFMTEQGKIGVFRITKSGQETTGLYWYILDILIEK
ncbi:MAG: VWD domain-containing protein [Spirosomaceae bacterium]|nr:VWD domain-containing protein [Spirosomataceae bacterium]